MNFLLRIQRMLSHSRNSQHFVEPEVSLPRPKELASVPYFSVIRFLAYFPYFEKIKLGLWDYVAVYVCVCVSPTVARQRLGKNPLIVARQLLNKNPLIVARKRLGRNPPYRC
jgi:hypothetical protein